MDAVALRPKEWLRLTESGTDGHLVAPIMVHLLDDNGNSVMVYRKRNWIRVWLKLLMLSLMLLSTYSTIGEGERQRFKGKFLFPLVMECLCFKQYHYHSFSID